MIAETSAAHEDDVVSGPATDESLRQGIEQCLTEITTTTLVLLAEQQSEERSQSVEIPFLVLETAIETLMTDDFLFRHVHGLEVLIHNKRGKEIERPSTLEDRLPFDQFVPLPSQRWEPVRVDG